MSRERNTELDLSAFDSKNIGHIDLNSFGSTVTPKSGSAGEIAKILQQLEALKEAEKYEGFHRWFIPGSPYSIDNLPKHRAFFKATKDYREVYFSASNQTGKFVRSTEPVLTPRGWVPIGELNFGDEVCAPDGTVAHVTGVYDQGVQQLYRVHFNDGTYVDCGGPHLWKCKGPTERFVKRYTKGEKRWDNPAYGTWTVKSLDEIIAYAGMEPKAPQRHSIPVVESLRYEDKQHPIDPYTLGVLLGDGSVKTGCGITSADPEILDLIAWKPDRIQLDAKKCPQYFFSGKLDLLREVGIYGTGCHNKAVPDSYKHSNERLAVLQGLMDTDGHAGRTYCEFVSVSKQLAQDVCDIARSLGIRCTLKEKKTSWTYKGEKKYSTAWRVCIWNTSVPLFRLSRKVAAHRPDKSRNGTENVIVKIEKIDSDNCRCIEVDSKDSTYIISNYVVTHNTSAGVYASVLHLTGEYPDWWEGKRYDRPVVGWALGDTTVTVRNILQVEFLGKQGEGTGMIPASYIVGTTAKAGSSGSKEKIFVRHKSGGVSELSLYSYEQGRKFFQGVKLDFVFMDELPPASLYGEAIMRTISTNGIVYVTATPLDGLTPVVLNFYTKADFLPEGSELPGVVKLAREDAAQSKGKNGNTVHEEVADDGRSKAVIVASWDDAPWLTEQAKKEILDSVPENERESRSKGLPTMGSGTVYPLALEEIVVPDFPIPDHYKKVGGLDVGWNFTAAGWIAQDPDSGVCYLYSEYKRSKAEPIIHAEAIKRRGDWINIAVDPASLGRGQADGKQIFSMYKKHGVRCHVADNAVEAGIYKVWEMLSTGQLKIFKSCIETQKEYLTYRRDDKGRVIKENDHLMDGALRYPIMSLKYARQKPVRRNPNNNSGIASGLSYDI